MTEALIYNIHTTSIYNSPTVETSRIRVNSRMHNYLWWIQTVYHCRTARRTGPPLRATAWADFTSTVLTKNADTKVSMLHCFSS